MTRFFVDTFYWIALSNRRDQWHARVRAFDDALTAYRLYTTDEVLTELLTFYSEGTPHTRRQAALYASIVLANPLVVVRPQSHHSYLLCMRIHETSLDKATLL